METVGNELEVVRTFLSLCWNGRNHVCWCAVENSENDPLASKYEVSSSSSSSSSSSQNSSGACNLNSEHSMKGLWVVLVEARFPRDSLLVSICAVSFIRAIPFTIIRGICSKFVVPACTSQGCAKTMVPASPTTCWIIPRFPVKFSFLPPVKSRWTRPDAVAFVTVADAQRFSWRWRMSCSWWDAIFSATHLWEPRTKAVPPPPGEQSERRTNTIIPWSRCPMSFLAHTDWKLDPTSICHPLPRTRRRLTVSQDIVAGCDMRFGVLQLEARKTSTSFALSSSGMCMEAVFGCLVRSLHSPPYGLSSLEIAQAFFEVTGSL